MDTFPEGALMTRGGHDDGRMVKLAMGVTTIGRVSLNDIVLDDPGVSRQHASIRGDSEGYWIQDHGSQNGTFVNGQGLNEGDLPPVLPRLLRDNDRIEIGGLETPFHWVFVISESTRVFSPTFGDEG